MASSQDAALSSWERVNKVAASLDFTGAAPAFRQAVAATDFSTAGPGFSFGDFEVHILDWLEGTMVYVDQSRRMAVVGRTLWSIISSHTATMETFVEDLGQGASGVKVIDYNSGPYRDAGRAWRRMHGELTPAQDPIATLREHLNDLLSRVAAVGDTAERSSEQYQLLFTQMASATEQHEVLQKSMNEIEALLDLARDAVANL